MLISLNWKKSALVFYDLLVKKVSMIRKCYYKPTQGTMKKSHITLTRHQEDSFKVNSLLHEDNFKTRQDTKYCIRKQKTKHRTPTNNGSNNKL